MAETYSIRGYGKMLADAVRRDAYCRALEATVRPGSVVLDIGTGTGFFAVLAAQLGARRVIGVDPTDLVRVAREVARENGVSDRVELIQALSTDVTLSEPADVVVFDLRGALPAFQQAVASVADARARLLAPGGVLIPRRDVMMAAPVHAPETWEAAVGPGGANGVRLGAARRAAVNLWTRDDIEPAQLLAPGQPWAALDYATVTDPNLAGTPGWTVERASTAHGLAVWFEADLADGVGFGTGPGTRTIYQTAFFPWPQPVDLAPGDRIGADLQARLIAGDYTWIWNTEIDRAGQAPLRFRQSTFVAFAPPPERMRKRAHDYRATLGEDGRIDAFVLSRMDGGATLGEIARELHARFPARFATWEAALAHAGRLSEQYAE